MSKMESLQSLQHSLLADLGTRANERLLPARVRYSIDYVEHDSLLIAHHFSLKNTVQRTQIISRVQLVCTEVSTSDIIVCIIFDVENDFVTTKLN